MWFEIVRDIFAVIGVLVALLALVIWVYDSYQGWAFYRPEKRKKK